MKGIRRTSIIALAAILSVLLALPAAGDAGRAAQAGDLITDAEELVIGRQLSGAVAQQFPLFDDPFVDRYLNHRGRQVAELSSRSQIPYFFHVVGDSTINAFAIPGGYIYLNAGIFQVAETEAEMMGILAHEIGHVVARHWAEQNTRQQLIGLATRVGLGAYPDRYAYMAANLFGRLGFLKWSRDDERQADQLGYQLMMKAGYHPEGMLGIFEELVKRQEQEPGDVATLFRTHPGAGERLADIRGMLEGNPPSDDMIRDTEEFQRVKARIEEEFPPPESPDSEEEAGQGGESETSSGGDQESSEQEGRSRDEEAGQEEQRQEQEDPPDEEQDEEGETQMPEVPEREPTDRWVHLGREAWRLDELAARLDERGSAGASQAARALRSGDMDAARSALTDLLDADAGDVTVRYARALARLSDTDGIDLGEPRADLAVVLREDPLYRDAFPLWMSLNPEDNELEAVEVALERADTPAQTAADRARAAGHRADLALWRDEPEEALDRLDEAGEPGAHPAWELARLRALFAAESDAEGQRHYFSLLDSGSPELLERLYRDLHPATTPDDRDTVRDLATFDSTPADSIHDREALEAWFRQFWSEADPLPADELNPRIAEHYRRLARARKEYGLQSNGDGYFVDWERFRQFSPQLPHFPTSLVFDDQRAPGHWIDHRGLWVVRHGDPDARIGREQMRRMGVNLPVTEAAENATWVFTAGLPQLLATHLARREPVGEWIQILNLGVAASDFSSTADDPQELSGDLGQAARQLYASRRSLDRLFAQIARTGRLTRLEELLRQESQAMASFSKAGRRLASTDFYDQENTIPVTLSLMDRKAATGKATMDVELAVQTGSIEWGATGEEPGFDVTLLLYDTDWQEVLRRVEHSYPVDSSRVDTSRQEEDDDDDDDGGVFFAAFEVSPVEPGTYNYAVQITERSSGRIGTVKGRHAVDYFRDDWVGLSDPAVRIRAADAPSGQQVAPSPAKVIPRGGTGLVAYEIYNLGEAQGGPVSYQLKDYVLKLREKQGLGDRLFSIGRQVGYSLFPLAGLVAELGLFTFDFLAEEESSRLEVDTRTLSGGPGTVSRSYRIVPEERELEPGIYELYLTVRDQSTGDVVTKSITFRVTESEDD